MDQFRQYIQGETLAMEIGFAQLPMPKQWLLKWRDYNATLYVKKRK